jgi:hypothetical protein
MRPRSEYPATRGLDHHVHRPPRLGSRRSLNLRIGIRLHRQQSGRGRAGSVAARQWQRDREARPEAFDLDGYLVAQLEATEPDNLTRVQRFVSYFV